MEIPQFHFPRAQRTSMVVAAAALLAACQPDSTVGVPQHQSPTRSALAELTAATTETLWDELTPVNGVLVGSPAGAVITPANDFVVPQGQAWTVSSIVIRGAAVIANPAITLNLEFRANDAGKPGAVIRSFTLTAVSKTAVDDQTNLADFRFDLTEPLTFRPGTYWLASQCSVSLVECGLGPVVGQQAFTTLDGGATWQPGFPSGATTPADNLFALIGSAVRGQDAISDLVTIIQGLGLDHGIESSLEAKLQTALTNLAVGDFTGACTALQDFVNLASAQAGKKLTSAQAADLIDAASKIRAVLGC